jgi:hypothetical protein
MTASVKQHWNIASAMENANHLNASVYRPVKYDVIAHGKAANFRRKVRTLPPEFRHLGQQLALLADGIKPIVSGDRVFFSNAVCDFDKIEICLAGSQYLGHQLCFLFRRRRTLFLTALILRGAKSPRSACSIPMAISRRSSSWRKRCRSLDSPSQRYNFHRSCAESRFVADLTSATVLIKKN